MIGAEKMTNQLDYNNESVLKILNNPNYTEEQKKMEFEKYKNDLKKSRRNEIRNRLNECAREIPIIDKDIYIDFLKKYDDDNLSKPFEVIEHEIKNFKDEMTEKYNVYLKNKASIESIDDDQMQEPEEEIMPDVVPEENKMDEKDEFDDTMFKDPEENIPDEVTPNLYIKDEVSVLNEEPETLAKPIFDNSKDTKEVMPDELPEMLNEKGNASAIILSIIAIIIGAIIMYSIIRLQ